MTLYINIFQMVLILLCTLITSYTDFKIGKVSNKVIIAFSIVAIITDIIIFVFLTPEATTLFLKNVIVTTIISLILYFTHIWAGGDCKLLILFCFMYPTSFYWNFNNVSLSLWYSVVITFIIGFIYILIESIILSVRNIGSIKIKSLSIELKDALINYVISLIYLAALSHLYLYFVLPIIKIPNVIYTCLCVLFVWFLNINRIFKSKFLIVIFLIFDILMCIFTKTITISTLWIHYVIVFIFLILRILINSYNYKIIKTSDIKVGMILSQVSSLLLQNSRVKGLPGISDETLKSRLSADEAESIKRWGSSKRGKKELTIVRKIPFAFFISCGIIIYFILGVFGFGY